jgi:hypothetical protein
MCAYISEIAACNGGPDINGDRRKADGTSLSLGDELAYTMRVGYAIGWTSCESTSRSAARKRGSTIGIQRTVITPITPDGCRHSKPSSRPMLKAAVRSPVRGLML